jgi:hypothetical protein
MSLPRGIRNLLETELPDEPALAHCLQHQPEVCEERTGAIRPAAMVMRKMQA